MHQKEMQPLRFEVCYRKLKKNTVMLDLRKICPYLPYGLKLLRLNKNDEPKIIYLNNGNVMYPIEYPERCKMILRHISEFELTKIVDTDMGKCTILDYISTSKKDSQLNARLILEGKYDQIEYWKIERLLQLHFDVFGLIEKGLAISIHDIPKTEK